MSILDDAKQVVQGLVLGAMTKAVAIAPESWVPGGAPDPISPHEFRHVGKPISRIDGPLKVAGQARFAAEFKIDGMVYASLVFSTIAKGEIIELNTASAEAVPGVVAVMTYRNAPRMSPPPVFLSSSKAAGGDDIPVMQEAKIQWNGQPVALVLAETQEQADHAASLVSVTYKTEVARTSFYEEVTRGTTPSILMGEPVHNEKGDAEGALEAAEFRVDETYSTPRHNHNAIEMHAVTVAWDGAKLRVHDASQSVGHTAWSLAQMFGIKEDQVVVTSPFVGGGFGGKCMWQHHALAAAASKLVGRPVRLTLSREGVYRIVGGRSPTSQRVALGADSEGKLKALIHSGVSAKSKSSILPESFMMQSRSAYNAETLLLDLQSVELDMLANTFMRAPGEAVGTFALESAMDELAIALSMDPIELRLRNEPTKELATGLTFSSRHIEEAWRAGAARFGWENRNAEPKAFRDGEWLIGTGCAMATHPYSRMPGGAARLTLTRGGRVVIDVAAHDMGMGTATVHGQVAAERLGIEPDAVTFNFGDSTLPGTVLAGGSQQTASIGAAVMGAHSELVKALVGLIGDDSPLAGLRQREIECADGGLQKQGDPGLWQSYSSILERAGRSKITVEVQAPQPLETLRWAMRSFGAMFCEVRVSAITGETRVTRFLGSFDCGRILNAKTATSQFRGGIIMGLGLALMEETQFDERSGRVMNPGLAEYHIPVHMDVPEIDVIWTDIPDPHAPMGAHGIGEIGITGTGAAVANAIYNATGKRVRDLPITLEKLL